MRYSMMLQLIVVTTLILGGAAAFFAWLQNRPIESESHHPRSSHPVPLGNPRRI